MANDPDLDDMIDPDGDEDARYSWDTDFQRHVIALLMTDKIFLLQSIDLIKPSYFTNKAHSKACSLLFDYFRKYNLLPKKNFLIQEAKEAFKDDKAKLHHIGEIISLYDYFEPGLEARQYLSDKITFFAKIQAIKSAFHQCLKQIEKNPENDDTWSKVYDLLRDAMNTDRNLEIGLNYFEGLKDRYARMAEDESDLAEKFVTGYHSIDTEIKGGGYKRGEMIAYVGGSGVGKSVALTCTAAINARRGKRVVYITTELSEDRVAERFDSILTGASINCLFDQKEKVFLELEKIVEDAKSRDLIVIKQFPSKTADVNTIRAYLCQLKFMGFTPDVVIVDYIGEMKDHPGIPTHESRERIVSELRGLSIEENVFLATAMQPNRGSKEAQKAGRIEEEHLADSFGQIRPLDGCFSLNQNDDESAVKIGRMWVIKQRFGKSRFQIYIRFDKDNLRITEISKDEYKNMKVTRSDKVADEVQIDNIVKAWEPKDDNDEDLPGSPVIKK